MNTRPQAGGLGRPTTMRDALDANDYLGEAYKELLATVEVMYDQREQGVSIGDRINTARDSIDAALSALDCADAAAGRSVARAIRPTRLTARERAMRA